MLHFDSDYMETAHPAILNRFTEIIGEQNAGYGFDTYTLNAAKKLPMHAENHRHWLSFLLVEPKPIPR